MKKISCIIPTYNEEPRIAGVLKIVAAHPMIDEVIVVDDGSTDKTIEVVRSFKKVRLIIHERNQGKSMAIYTGVQASMGDYVMFIDADLLGLNEQNLTDLINPVKNDECDVTLSLRRNAPRLWKTIGLDYISGERVMPRQFILEHADEFRTLPKFGLESFLNIHIIKNKFRIKIVRWPNVYSPYKYLKFGWWKGIKSDIFMIMDIFRTISIFGPIYQIIRMKKLEIR